MRRPALYFSAFFGAGIFTAFYIETDILMWIILLTFALAFFVYAKLFLIGSSAPVRSGFGVDFIADRIVLAALTICIFSAGGLRLAVSEYGFEDMTNDFGKTMKAEGMITEFEKKDSCDQFVLKGKNRDYLVKCRDVSELCAGSRAQVTGTLIKPQGKRNPRCFDYALYLKSRGVGAILEADRVEVMDEGEARILKVAAAIRVRLYDELSKVMDDDTKAMIIAMAFGDKTLLDEDTYSDFQRNGTAHVLAVSGLHVGVLYGFFAFLWRGKKGTIFYSATLIILLLYASLAEFSPSVVRAAVMITLHAISGILKRRYDFLSAGAVTFTIMTAAEPFVLFNTGFQLSFLAVASLGVVLPYIKRFYSGVLLGSAAIQVGMVPYTAYLFNYVSAGALIANVPVVFLAGILIPVIFCMMIAMVLPGGVFSFAAHLAEIGCDLMVKINGFFYAGGALTVDVASPPVWSLTIYYGSVFFMMSETGRLAAIRKMKKRIAAVFAALLVAAVAVASVTCDGFDKAAVTFVYVGQGDCVHVRTTDGKHYLIDGGGSDRYDVGIKTLKPYLLKNGVRKIDAAFVTHLHTDHYEGVKALASDGMVERIAVYEANRLFEKEIRGETGAELMYIYAGQRITLGEDIYLDILAPERRSPEEYREMAVDSEDENESCLVFMLVYKDVKILITGDIDAGGENALIEKCGTGRLDCDILKVPHHGSRYSSSPDFVDICEPDIAVFQVGKNNYGHPSEEVIERYEAAGAEIFRNDTDGAVGIEIDRRHKVKVVKTVD